MGWAVGRTEEWTIAAGCVATNTQSPCTSGRAISMGAGSALIIHDLRDA